MGDFIRDRESGRDRSRGPRRRSSGGFDRFRREKPEMHDVVCDECGKECKVPFKPTSSKPIYCSECFDKKGGSSSRGRPNSSSSKDLEQINQKLDKIMKALKIE